MASKRLALAVAAMTVFGAAPADAQIIGLPADVASGNCYPFACTSGTRYQQVYAAFNFASPFSISSISFFNTEWTTGNLNSGTYSFYFSTTSAAVDALSSDFDANLGGNNTFWAQYVLGGGDAPEVLTFANNQNPFVYDPSAGNLLLDIRATGLSHVGGTTYLDARNATAGGIFSRMHDFGGGFEGYGLVTEFNASDVPPPVSTIPEPATMLLLGTGLVALAIPAARRRRRGEDA